MMKVLKLSWLLGLVSVSAMAGGGGPVILGDGDPFPVACVDFSGVWHSDKDQSYGIGQKGCEQLQVVKSDGHGNYTTTIVPDNRSRSIYGDERGDEWKGTVRHRWNSLRYGSAVETHRKMVFEEKTVTEFVTLEEINDNLLLENTYRVSEGEGGVPKYEYSQQVFRREGAVRRGTTSFKR